MKFGRNLPRNQVPEWASNYINYKKLKKLIKSASENSRQQDGSNPDLAGFLHALDRNLEDVDYFYNKKFQDFSRRLKLLEDRYGFTLQNTQDIDSDESQDLLAALLELRAEGRKLTWYGEVNRRGFIKITKKLDKKIPSAQAQQRYLELKVEPAPFATNSQLVPLLTKVNDWISILTEAAVSARPDDTVSIGSGSLKRTTSRPSLEFSAERLGALENHLRTDDALQLEKFIIDAKKGLPKGSEPSFQSFLKTLLHKAIALRGKKSITTLLQYIVFLDEQDDLNRRNCIHRLVIAIGRTHTVTDDEEGNSDTLDVRDDDIGFITPAASPSKPFKRTLPHEPKHSRPLTSDGDAAQFLVSFLDKLNSVQRSALSARDSYGRSPLHFAAEYGVRALCEIIVERLQAWKMFDVSQGIDGPNWQDDEGWAPLHLAVIGGHPKTTQYLLDSERSMKDVSAPVAIRRNSPQSSAVLALAVKSDFIEVVRILVAAGVDINFQDESGETALHVAARYGHTDCARLLVAGSQAQIADLELRENTYSWTPLFIACIDGHLPVVELLIDANADLDTIDSSGWTAQEHASLRGHIEIAARLDELTRSPDHTSNTSASTSPPIASSLNDRYSNGFGTQQPPGKLMEPVKTFGHRYLTDKSMILVSLGSMDTRKNVRSVNLDRIPLANAHSTQLDTALSIVVSAKGADGEPEVFDLPVQDNICTEPIVFLAADPDKAKIYFDLIPTYSGARDRVVGRGVALISSLTTNLGGKKMPLKGDLTVPIVASGDMEAIGSVTFNYLIIKPFHHPNMSLSENKTYWKSMTSTMLIGHRGLGKNFGPGRRSLQLGENTIQSFIAAANLGASYVEFDVQLTKDHVPVIYHDFTVSETGIDAPVHTLTLEQFLSINDMRTPRQSRPASPTIGPPRSKAMPTDPRDRARMRSMSVGGDHEAADLQDRARHTRPYKLKGFVPNTRGTTIQAPFTTLEEMFRTLPSHMSFNIEMKYPMLFESEDDDMDTYAIELNVFVDTVLKMVYDLGKGRNIIFSSFHPDLCLLLSFKQPNIPVLFLTDAGTSEVGDIRASSLQEAIRFASRWNLLGIVSASEVFVYAPRLVRVVKETGLVCVSYGVMNNDPASVALQTKQGIDAVIVDSVLAIQRSLLTSDSAVRANGVSGPMVGSLASVLKLGSDSTESLEIPKVSLDEGTPLKSVSSVAVDTPVAATTNGVQALKV
ncbi:Glycerophosphodiester phosphodiesterase GDE1 [Cyphellophora attinorum]|uniref:Glycerophosphodiester phosphodiesterase GDE1 n=1 Tax=Cyphellophora attinorum TaxID=1664694 RepID=A0A0N0NKT5_9EURO|nr:Glycerophosphodiester phosphodiesterase GDE1 [Phialophora attinorum]KPI38521.1 Glycerophosphodiester phosphodiesterase GDE1 [Phialophora attinorum]